MKCSLMLLSAKNCGRTVKLSGQLSPLTLLRYQEAIVRFNCSAASIFLSRQLTKPPASLNSKQKATAVAAAAPAVCLFAQQIFCWYKHIHIQIKECCFVRRPCGARVITPEPGSFFWTI